MNISYMGAITPMDNLANKYHTDKGGANSAGTKFPWPSHTYTDVYYLLLSRARLTTKLVFEFGIGSNNESMPNAMTKDGSPGASLRMWKEFFPNATVLGADIDKSILFTEERIQTYYTDQLDLNALCAMWGKIEHTDFDLIIDDGYHTFTAGVNTFESSIGRLSNTGMYIIEDVSDRDLIKYIDYFNGNIKYSVMFIQLHDKELLPVDNNLIIISTVQAIVRLQAPVGVTGFV
jgi:hypothetical protein